jgi:quercetin dioxygenase-like cupin family protein
MIQPVISNSRERFSFRGDALVIHEWAGSGPDYMHVHYEDDEAWHVLEGSLLFTFPGQKVEAAAGTTVVVPAGLVHTYEVGEKPCRYLIILTPRLDALIKELMETPYAGHTGVMMKYRSEIVR